MRAAWTQAERERGSVSVWLVTASFVMTILVGLAVDLGGQVHAQQRARDIAAQAARAGGQQVWAGPAVRGAGARIDTAAARTAAQRYLTAAGVTGTVSIHGGDTILVATTTSYRTQFLSIIGLSTLTVTGHADAQLIRAVQGVAQ